MGIAALAACGGAALAVIPALGANQSVTANSNNTFTPKTVTIDVGETVSWHNNGGDHNVVFDDAGQGQRYRNGDPSVGPWNASHKFSTAGTFQYYCEVHRSSGMVGTVVVNGGAGTTTPTQTTPTAGPALVSVRVAKVQHGMSVRGRMNVGYDGSRITTLLKQRPTNGRGRILYGRAVRSAVAAGRAGFVVTLNRRGRAALRKSGRLGVSLYLVVDPPGSAVHASRVARKVTLERAR
ncbi:MAG: hypothetical protein QOI98_2199 [Solirubrobacteraceae bacterium]|jgi:plastocyanin|nr:hypothetical protein [Solirubrobacteraceae bacterium]